MSSTDGLNLADCASMTLCPPPALGRKRVRMHRARQPAVYILASRRYGTLYVGVTSNLEERAWQHRNNLVAGFSRRYGVHRLVYYELHGEMLAAIRREKALKKWNRRWKVELIETINPEWRDLYENMT